MGSLTNAQLSESVPGWPCHFWQNSRGDHPQASTVYTSIDERSSAELSTLCTMVNSLFISCLWSYCQLADFKTWLINGGGVTKLMRLIGVIHYIQLDPGARYILQISFRKAHLTMLTAWLLKNELDHSIYILFPSGDDWMKFIVLPSEFISQSACYWIIFFSSVNVSAFI